MQWTGIYWFIVELLWISRIAQCQDREGTYHNDNFLVVADGRSGRIIQMSINGTEVKEIVSGQSNPIAVTYDPVNQDVYWTEVGQNKRTLKKKNIASNSVTPVVIFGGESMPEGVAVDPVAGLIFLTDNGKDIITVMNITGTSQKTIVSHARGPRSIEIDPINRQIYWTDWGLHSIERSNYDGSNRTVLYSDQGAWINGLTLDLQARSMFWVDAYHDRVGKADLDGNNNQTVYQHESESGPEPAINTPHYFDITGDSTHLYMTIWKTGSVWYVYPDVNPTPTALGQNISATGSLNGIHMYQSKTYIKGEESPCNKHNGGCSDICIPVSDTESTCLCPDLKRLQDDNKTCTTSIQANGPDLIWVEFDSLYTGYIKGIAGKPEEYLRTTQLQTWSTTSPAWHWTALDMSYDNNKLFLIDKIDKMIVQLSLNGTLEIKSIYQGISSQANGIAYDWTTKILYFTDSLYNTIMIAKAESRTNITKTLIYTNLDSPHGIAVYPQKGLLYWTDWGTVDKIEVATLAGEDRRILVGIDLNKPRGMTIDYDNYRIYWCNENSIESVASDGTDRIRFAESDVSNYYDISMYGNYLFALDQRSPSYLWFFDITKEDTPGRKWTLTRKPYGLAMYAKERQPKYQSPCETTRCQHLCLNHYTSARCVCLDGYTLNEDGTTCNATSLINTPTYVYSMDDRICAVSTLLAIRSIPNPDKNCFFDDEKYSFMALSYHFAEGYIYFSETKFEVNSIRRANLKDKKDNDIIVYGTGLVKGLAIDWLSNNIYWADQTSNQIWISRIDGTYMKQLISGLDTVHGVIVDVKSRRLYWSESGSGKIMKALMDGTQAQVFMEGLEKPTGLQIDYTDPDEDRVYWHESGKKRISSSNLHGANLRHKSMDETIYDFNVNEDYIAVTVSSTSEGDEGNPSKVKILKKSTGEEAASPITHEGQKKAFDIVAFSNTSQPWSSGIYSNILCGFDNGGCEQLCVPLLTSVQCLCVDGMVLDTDGTTCKPSLLYEDDFYMLADDYRHQIYTFRQPDLSDLSALKFPAHDRPIAVEYDFRDKWVYWSDFKNGTIKRMFLNGTGLEVVLGNAGKSRRDGLAFDPISRLLYYTDTGNHIIGVIDPEGVYHKVLIDSGIRNPRDIVLDPEHGVMYFTVRDSAGGKIMMSDMDGLNPSVVIDSQTPLTEGTSSGSHVLWPNGLHIDFKNYSVYWVDGHTERIERANLDGTGRKEIYIAHRDANPFALVKNDGYLFWTDWGLSGLFRINEDGSKFTVLQKSMLTGLNDLKYFNSKNLPVPTCTTDLPNGFWDQDCNYREDATCNYFCVTGFGKTEALPLQCMWSENGLVWEKDLNSLCHSTTCPALVPPIHAEISQEVPCPHPAGPGIHCELSCIPGYDYIEGTTSYTCDNGRWVSTIGEDAPLRCEETPICSPLPELPHTVIHPPECATKSQGIGSNCTYFCELGYVRETDGRDHRMCQRGGEWTKLAFRCVPEHHDGSTTVPVPHENKQDKGVSFSTVIIAAAVVAVVVLLALILIVVFFVCRRRRDRKYEDDRQPVVTPNVHSPVYDVRNGNVNLGNSFDNPEYTNFNDIQNTKNSNIEGASGGVQASPLPIKKPLSESDIKVDTNGGYQNLEFENPTYAVDNIKQSKV